MTTNLSQNKLVICVPFSTPLSSKLYFLFPLPHSQRFIPFQFALLSLLRGLYRLHFI